MPQKKSPDVSVIIVSYNVRDYLHQALVSLNKSLKKYSSEIIVVDNASDDGSVDMVRKRFPKVKLIENKENVGFARANNSALKIANGKYLFLINPDTLVQEDTVKVLYDFMEAHPDAGMVGCKILNPDGTLQLPCRRSFPTPWVAFTKIFGLSSLFPESKIFGKYNITYKSPDETYPVDAISGSCMFLRRAVYEQVGGLDEDFYLYGEDLDWCYRIKKGEWQIYYVHSTQIIHYKGESTKRSNIDELSAFYEAMRIYVEKHYSFAPFLVLLLKLSIAIVSFVASLSAFIQTYAVAIIDAVCIALSVLLAELIRRGRLFVFPTYAYTIIYPVPILLTITLLAFFGVYTKRKMSLTHSALAVITSYVILSALAAFFKQYAFSRALILYSGIFSVILLPGWRFLYRMVGKYNSNPALWQRRAIILGTGKSSTELVQKIRHQPASGYNIIGFVSPTHTHIGENILGVPVISSVDSLRKVIREYNITDVIFAPHSIPYKQMLTIISDHQTEGVVFHMVPGTLEVLVGKASVEMLDEVPLVELSYNINKPLNRFTKRAFDILCSLFLLLTVYPIFVILRKENKSVFVQNIPKVLIGKYSLVGREINEQVLVETKSPTPYLGKPGLTGIVQLLSDKSLTEKEKEQYEIYYARNQSISVDVEILMKTFIRAIR